MQAAVEGQEEIVRLLLARGGVRYNARDNDGLTAIALAAEYSHPNIVEMLL